MKIRLFILSLIGTALSLSQIQAEDIVQVLPLRTTAGITTSDARSVDFVLSTSETTPVWGYQLDILLPDGVQFDESLPTPFTLSATRHPQSGALCHHIDYTHLPTGWWRIIVTPDDDTHLTGKTGLILQARYTTESTLGEGLHPIRVKRSVIATSGTEAVSPMLSTSYVVVGDETFSTNKHVDFSEAQGLLPTFVIDSLNHALYENYNITRLDIRNVDTIAKPLLELPNLNALTIAKYGAGHAQALNTIAWSATKTPVCHQMLLEENGGTFEMPFDFHVDDMRMARKIYKSKWNTLCLPFDMTNEQIRDSLGHNTQIGVFMGIQTDQLDNEYLLFERQDTLTYTIEAHRPYLIVAGNLIDTLRIQDTDLSVPITLEQNFNNFVFLGTYDANIPIPVGSYYISNNLFYKSTGLSTQRPFRGYFRDDRSNSSNVKQLSFTFWEDEDDEETGINNTTIRLTDPAPTYNLQGLRIAHPRRGIYIRNGRKLIIK